MQWWQTKRYPSLRLNQKQFFVLVDADTSDTESKAGIACSGSWWCSKFILVASGAGQWCKVRRTKWSWLYKSCSTLDNPTGVGWGAGDVLHAESGGPTSELKVHAWLYIALVTLGRATGHKTVGGMQYTGKPMHEYIAKWESCSAQPASMDDMMDDGLLPTTFNESFRDQWKSLYGMATSAFLTMDDPTLQALVWRFIQNCSSQNATKSASFQRN